MMLQKYLYEILTKVDMSPK